MVNKIVKTSALLLLIVLFLGQYQAHAQASKIKELYEGGQVEQALAEAKAQTAEKQKDPEVWYLKGKILLELEKVNAAMKAFDTGIETKPKYPLNYVGKGLALLKQEKKEEGVQQVNTALEKYGKYNYNDTEMHLAIGYAYTEFGGVTFSQGEKIFYKVDLADETNPLPKIALGDLYFNNKAYDSALDSYLEAIKRDKKYIKGYLRIGQVYLQKDSAKKGYDFLNQAIELDPEFAPSYRERGELFFRGGEFERARDDYKKYVELTGNDRRARTRYASFLYLSGNHDEAISEIEALEADTITTVMRRLKAYSYTEKGDYAKAQAALDDYFDQTEEKYHLANDYEYQGKIYLGQENFEKADEFFAKAVGKDSSRAVLYQNLANQFKEDEKPQLQAKYLSLYTDKALDLDLNAKLKNYYYVGRAYYDAFKAEPDTTQKAELLKKGDKAFEAVLGIKSDYIAGHGWRARLNDNLDKLTPKTSEWLAKPHYEKIIGFLGEQPIADLSKADKSNLKYAYAYLGAYYFEGTDEEAANDCDAAMPYFNKVNEIEPGSMIVSQFIEYCNGLNGETEGTDGGE